MLPICVKTRQKEFVVIIHSLIQWTKDGKPTYSITKSNHDTFEIFQEEYQLRCENGLICLVTHSQDSHNNLVSLLS